MGQPPVAKMVQESDSERVLAGLWWEFKCRNYVNEIVIYDLRNRKETLPQDPPEHAHSLRGRSNPG
jgi:hypothetical protein